MRQARRVEKSSTMFSPPPPPPPPPHLTLLRSTLLPLRRRDTSRARGPDSANAYLRSPRRVATHRRVAAQLSS